MTTRHPVHLLAGLLIVVLVGAGLPQAPRTALASMPVVAPPRAALAHPPAPEVLQTPASPAAQASPPVPEWVVRELPNGAHSTTSVALGDVDGDGVLDIVQGNYGAASEVLLGQGTGVFSPSLVLPNGARTTRSVALGDLNGDRVLDIVLANDNEADEVLLGQGTGTFSPSLLLPDDTRLSYTVALGDLNGDGKLDIVRSSWGSPPEVLLGQGTGTFSPSLTLSNAPYFTTSVALGDLNNDGMLDIVLGTWGEPSEVLLGRGDNMFSPGLPLPNSSRFTIHVALGDLNGDGVLDIVLGNTEVVSQVLLGQGDGTFSPGLDLPSSKRHTNSVALGDVNRDAVLDIVLGGAGAASEVLLGQGDGTFSPGLALPSSKRHTNSVALGDLNRDGVSDIVLGNTEVASEVLLGQDNGTFISGLISPNGAHDTMSIALGDVNRDGKLDIVQGSSGSASEVLLGQGNGTFTPTLALPNGARPTQSVALGDVNGDRMLDIVQGNYGEPSEVLLGQGNGTFTPTLALPNGTRPTRSVALGDVNGDGKLDIVQGNYGEPSEVLLGQGNGAFTPTLALPNEARPTWSLALGDVNGDGKLDIVQGNSGAASEVLLGQGTGMFSPSLTLGNGARNTESVALGDVNGDGLLDIVQGNGGDSEVLLGQGNGRFAPGIVFPKGPRPSSSVALGDVNGDGVLDIVQGSFSDFGPDPGEVLLGRGDGTFLSSTILPNGRRYTTSVALGDVNGDGVLDIVQGNSSEASEVLLGRRNSHFAPQPGERLNRTRCPDELTSTPIRLGLPGVRVYWPRESPTDPLSVNIAPTLHSGEVVRIPYTLSVTNISVVEQIQGFYSLDGGGFWQPATPVSAASRCEGKIPVFAWDTVADGITGQYSQVLFRIEALPNPRSQQNQVAGPYRYASFSGTSPPFRLRGTQARVVDTTGRGVNHTRVYRLRQNTDPRDGQLTPPQTPGNPQWFTDWRGYLKGHGVLTPTDRLVALAPITATDTYTLFLTSARPTPQGLDFYQVRSSGVQTLTVRPEHPLILFNLDVSLEWDARSDALFRGQLEANLKRASELLFRWSGGQVALGDLRVFNNRERWNEADIRIYATNRLRPNAAQGGIVTRPLSDTLKPEVSYTPGQLRIGAVWDRYGDSGANLGEDWARTLAHELGHYALFLNDNYLGKDALGRLISVDTCRGPMADPYRDDYGMFHPSGDEWKRDCSETLSQLENERSDWATIKHFYDHDGLKFALNMPQVFDASATPELLPLAVTRVQFAPSSDTTAKQPLSAPVVLLAGADGKALKPAPQTWARAVLYQGDRLIDLGAPSEDQLLARGARPGDRVCLYDYAQTTRVGCTQINTNYQKLQLAEAPGWRPDIRITSATSQSLQVRVENVPPGAQLQAQFYPADYAALASVPFSPDGEGYTATIQASPPANEPLMLEGALRIWVEGPPLREAVVDVHVATKMARLGGSAVPQKNCPTCTSKKKPAPVLSGDGQAILSTEAVTLTEGAFYALQAVDSPPAAPSWATPVGRAYRLNASVGLNWAGSSLSISYFGADVEQTQEKGIRMLFQKDGAREWQVLDTALDADHNQVSVLVQGPGLYMLMTSAKMVLKRAGWNLVPFYFGVQQATQEAVATIAGEFTSIYGYDPRDTASPWRIYDQTVPPAWAAAVNDLTELRYEESYWIYATRPVTWFVRAGPEAPGAQATQLNLPPATYYGLAPRAGLTVEALVDGASCGSAQTAEADIGMVRRAVFVVKVRALGDDNTECGVQGRPVKVIFRDGEREVRSILTTWDNRQAHLLAAQDIYLPLVRR